MRSMLCSVYPAVTSLVASSSSSSRSASQLSPTSASTTADTSPSTWRGVSDTLELATGRDLFAGRAPGSATTGAASRSRGAERELIMQPASCLG